MMKANKQNQQKKNMCKFQRSLFLRFGSNICYSAHALDRKISSYASFIS